MSELSCDKESCAKKTTVLVLGATLPRPWTEQLMLRLCRAVRGSLGVTCMLE